MICARFRRFRGFTLVELAVVLTIIALILGVVLTQTGLLNTGNAIHVTGIVQDLVKTTGEFRNRYKFMPGDFPAAASDLPGVTCAGDGNGAVDLASATTPPIDETACAPDHLYRANLIRAAALTTKYGPVRIVSRASGLVAGHPDSVRNVIELCIIPQDVAAEVDAKIDDANLAAGSVLWTASVAAPWCTGGATNTVSLMSVALR